MFTKRAFGATIELTNGDELSPAQTSLRLRRHATMDVKHVAGKNKGKVFLYALSTCGWCRKTKQLLNEIGVAYDFIDVDHLEGKEKEETLDTVRKWNPSCSFPTLIVKETKCIVGFDEKSIRESLK